MAMLSIPDWRLLRPARSVVVYGFALVLLFAVLGWSIGSSPASLSAAENESRSNMALSKIVSDPINAPYRLLHNLLYKISPSLFGLRLTSLVLAVIFLACFYISCRNWLGQPVALLSSIILATTPLFMLLARNGSPDVMFLTPLAIIGAYLLLSNSEGESLWAWLVLTATVALSLYTPGMLWLIVPGAIAYSRQLKDFAREHSNFLIPTLIAAILFLILPLILAGVEDLQVAKHLLLIPDHISGLKELAASTGWMGSALLFKSRHHETFNLGRQAILDVLQVGLLVFGGYVMWLRLRSKLYWLVGMVALSIILAGINHNYNLLALGLPMLAIIMAMGLRYLYIEWRSVFPKNPWAKTFAITLMSAVVLIHAAFGIRYVLAAWPASVDTKRVYVLK